jgi:hypothetical protein
VETFVEKLEQKNVFTVGQFCSLKVFQLKGLPIAHKRRGSTGFEVVRERADAWLRETCPDVQKDDQNGVTPPSCGQVAENPVEPSPSCGQLQDNPDEVGVAPGQQNGDGSLPSVQREESPPAVPVAQSCDTSLSSREAKDSFHVLTDDIKFEELMKTAEERFSSLSGLDVLRVMGRLSALQSKLATLGERALNVQTK